MRSIIFHLTISSQIGDFISTIQFKYYEISLFIATKLFPRSLSLF